MTKQPLSAEAKACADEIGYSWPAIEHERIARILDRFAERVCEQRVSAETERWQNRDRQRLEQIGRLQETVQGFQSARDERPAPEQPHWRPGATAPKEHGVEISIKIAHARGVPAYWDAELQTFVLSRPVNVESVRDPLGWQPLVQSAPASTGEQPAPEASFAADLAAAQEPLGPEFEKVLHHNLDQLYVRSEPPAALVDHTERARKVIALVENCAGDTALLVGTVAAEFSAVASERDAAAIRAFGQRVWSDTEEVAYQAGVSDTRARLQEPDVREAVKEALFTGREPSTSGPYWQPKADAVIAVIAEMLR